MPFVTPLELRYAGVGRYELTADLVYRGAVDTIVVPAGTGTDLATIPRVVRWLLPQDGPWAAAAVLHDFHCVALADVHVKGPGWRQWRQVPSSHDVDGLFRRCCREGGVPPLARWLLWTGVRYGALLNPARRDGWLRDAPAVFALSLLAAPLVVPASLVVLAALAVYAVAEAVVSLFDPTAGGPQ
jgi:hypothetical protein